MNDIPTLKRIKKRVDKLTADCVKGKHSLDFVNPDEFGEPWFDRPVIFLFRGDTEDSGGTEYTDTFSHRKKISLAKSAVKLFRLSNAFVTSFDADGCTVEKLDLSLYKVAEALSQDFKDEIYIFAFGQHAADTANSYMAFKNKNRGKDDKKIRYKLCPLPSPTACIADDNRKYVLFGKMFKFLSAAGADCTSAVKEFLSSDSAAQNRRVNLRDIYEKLAAAFKSSDGMQNLVIKPKKSCRFIKSADILIDIAAEKDSVLDERLSSVACYCKNYSVSTTNGIGFGYNTDSQEYFIFDYTRGENRSYEQLAADCPEFARLYDIFTDYIERKID